MSILNHNTDTGRGSYPFVTAIVVAAGNSTRMNGINKQFLLIDGVPVLIRTLRAFSECSLINEIIVAAREEDIPKMHSMLRDYGVLKVKEIVTGGATRQQSVYNAFCRCSPLSEFIAIHDGARALVTPDVITDTLIAAFETGAAATGVRVKDTIKVVDENSVIVSTPPRENLWAVQTPQVFSRRLYLNAIDSVKSAENFTDDCRLIEEYGHQITMVEGSYDNIKITTPEDITLAEAIIRKREQND